MFIARDRLWAMSSIVLFGGLYSIMFAVLTIIDPSKSLQFQIMKRTRPTASVASSKSSAHSGADVFSLFLYISLGVLLFSGFMDLWRWFAFDGWYVPSWAISGMCFGMVAVIGCMVWLKRNKRLVL